MARLSDTRWIAVDWGTSHLRLWLMGDVGVIDERRSDKGMGHLTPDAFEETFRELVADLTPAQRMPVICCGMVGAKQGWAEAPYAMAPCKPPSISEAVQIETGPYDVFILPGVAQASPADVMRGEETQIAGFLLQNPQYEGVLCLPGTHTKWAHISAGEIVSFRTFMTGELYALMSTQSVLRHSVDTEAWDAPTFAQAVTDAMARPADLGARLFTIRASNLLDGTDAGVSKARLSGLLIGTEIAGAKPYWLGQEVAIVGAGPLSALYQTALKAQAADARLIEADAATLAGLLSAYTNWKAQA